MPRQTRGAHDVGCEEADALAAIADGEDRCVPQYRLHVIAATQKPHTPSSVSSPSGNGRS
jgi:hypothetical protein